MSAADTLVSIGKMMSDPAKENEFFKKFDKYCLCTVDPTLKNIIKANTITQKMFTTCVKDIEGKSDFSTLIGIAGFTVNGLPKSCSPIVSIMSSVSICKEETFNGKEPTDPKAQCSRNLATNGKPPDPFTNVLAAIVLAAIIVAIVGLVESIGTVSSLLTNLTQ